MGGGVGGEEIEMWRDMEGMDKKEGGVVEESEGVGELKLEEGGELG